jgi:DNA-binding transcriptional regulator YiaG
VKIEAGKASRLNHEIAKGPQAVVRMVEDGPGRTKSQREITLVTTTLEMPDRPPEIGAEELTKLRLDSGLSQSIFAQVLNVSTKTVQSWEQGLRKPSQAALRLLQVFRQNSSGLLELVGMSARNQGTGRLRGSDRKIRFTK